MFCQPIPGSEKTIDEFCDQFWNQPISTTADKCLHRLTELDRYQVINAFDSDPEGFQNALADTFQRFSTERKAQQLRYAMGTLSQESLLTLRFEQSNNPRTLRDIDEELRDGMIRERIVTAAVRAIENNTRNSWDHNLLDSDKDHVLWKRCEQYLLHGDTFFSDPKIKPSLYYSAFTESLVNRFAQRTPSAEEACMNIVENAKQLHT